MWDVKWSVRIGLTVLAECATCAGMNLGAEELRIILEIIVWG